MNSIDNLENINPKIQGHKKPDATLYKNEKNPLWDIIDEEDLEFTGYAIEYSTDEEMLIDNIHSMMYDSDPDYYSDDEIDEWVLQNKMGQDIEIFGEAVDRSKGIIIAQNQISKISKRGPLNTEDEVFD